MPLRGLHLWKLIYLWKFWKLNLSIFLLTSLPLVGCKALRVLVPFATSNLCKASFSAVAVIKSKYRNKTDIERDMRVAISHIAPRFNKMCIEQQAYCLH